MERKTPVKLTVTFFIFALLIGAIIYFLPIAKLSSYTMTTWELFFEYDLRIYDILATLLGGNSKILITIAEISIYVAVISFALDVIIAVIYLFGGKKSRFVRLLNKFFLIIGAIACLAAAAATLGSLIYAAIQANSIDVALNMGSYAFLSFGVIALISFFLKLAAFAKTKVN